MEKTFRNVNNIMSVACLKFRGEIFTGGIAKFVKKMHVFC